MSEPPTPSPVSQVLLEMWQRHGRRVLWISTVALFGYACLKLGDEVPRLLWKERHGAATDLRKFHFTVTQWTEGVPIYRRIGVAVYPPASYPVLWPLVGWLPWSGVRWVWAATAGVALAGLIGGAFLAARPTTRSQRWWLAGMVLALNATGVTIGIGQLGLHCLAAVTMALVVLSRRPGWVQDLGIAALFVFALAKPTVTAPFFWIFVLAPGRWRPAILTVLGYVGATALGLWPQLQQGGAENLLGGSTGALGDAVDMASRGAYVGALQGGYANVSTLLAKLGLHRFANLAAVGLLAMAGLWVLCYRQADRWLQLGVMALFARLWTYHRVYDDVLLLLPMIALFRFAKGADRSQAPRPWAGVWLGACTLAMLAPARWRHDVGLLGTLFRDGHALLWLGMLAYLWSLAVAENARWRASGSVFEPSIRT